MPEKIDSRKVFSLVEVTLSIQKTLAERYTSAFWVKAEMNKLNHYSHSGHCYPELVEKVNGKVIAQLKSNLWKSDFERINQNFLQVLKEPLKDGIKILFSAAISFDSIHGLSLRILEIDPAYSLGELEREKLETLERLKREGIFSSNKMMKLSRLPQRIAVISVETSKGYSDFLKIIEHNPWGYAFFRMLFPSLLQGDKSVLSICNQLKQIKKVAHHFDVVAIIRGGGGDVGLSSYNNYELAREIALFPIPVLTGIGHSTNETVAEMVSFKNAITPTELADYLIQKFHDFSQPMIRAEEIITARAKRTLEEENIKFLNLIRYFKSITKSSLMRNKAEVRRTSEAVLQHSKFLLKHHDGLLRLSASTLKKHSIAEISKNNLQCESVISRFKMNILHRFKKEKETVQQMEKGVSMLDPINILKRGFSITLYQGKVVKDYSTIKSGDKITTVLAEGSIESEVTKSSKT